MKMNKWTPGEWIVSKSADTGDAIGVSVWLEGEAGGHTGYGIAQPFLPNKKISQEQTNANAQLMSASKDLYSALEETRAACAACMRVIAQHELADEMEIEMIAAGIVQGFGARAGDALKKARGEQP